MNSLSSFRIITFVLGVVAIIVFTYFLLKQIYVETYHGKLIFKLDKRNNLIIFWVITSLFAVFLLIITIGEYIHYKDLFYIAIILSCISLIELCILGIIVGKRYSEIRENGIYLYLGFYKWNRVREYNWILPNKIQFKVNVFLNINQKFKLAVLVEEKGNLQINEVLHRNIHS
jgi:hypothetical protein